MLNIKFTPAERKTLTAILDVMAGFKAMQAEAAAEPGRLAYNGDNQELCYHIHALQNWVLANLAARAMPGEYRPYGAQWIVPEAHKNDREKAPVNV